MRAHRLFGVIAAALLLFPAARAAEIPSEPARLDGVTIDVVENLANPASTELALGAGLFPAEPYHLGFSLDAGATYYFSPVLGWEILRGSYVFSVDKDLTAELARNFGVTPASIERLEFMVSTSLVLVPTYGKSVLFNSILQYFRTGLTLGPGLVKTTQASRAAVCLGAWFETQITPSFSVRFDLRDSIALNGGKHYLSLGVGSGIYF